MNNDYSANWPQLLQDALNQPGLLHKGYSLFHNFSIGNQLLAMSQLSARGIPLGPLKTFKQWQKMDRMVNTGESGIYLFMPITLYKKDEKGEKKPSGRIFAFKKYWFALSQTKGKEYSLGDVVIPNWDSKQAFQKLELTEIKFEMLNGNSQGYATTKKEIAINPLAVLPHKTLFHEMAHQVLKHTDTLLVDSEKLESSIMEVEAESVAYLLLDVLNLDGKEYSRGYIQNWIDEQGITDKMVQRIFKAANQILEAGLPEKVKEETN